MSNPLVSILICCHNGEEYLKQMLESVFGQRYEPVEVVVVDDGSTDNTPLILNKYTGRIRCFHQENQGIAAARNAACQQSNGEFIAFQDDDDLMPPDRIVDLYTALQARPSAVIAVGDWAGIDANGNLTGQKSASEHSCNGEYVLLDDGCEAVLWPRVAVAPHTTLFRKADGDRVGWFDSRFRSASEDKDFFARLGQLGPIVYVPKVVSYYRRLASGSLTSDRLTVAYNQLLLFEKHLNHLEPHQIALRRRLQFRILLSLKKIDLYKSRGMQIPGVESNEYLKRGLALLGLKYRLAYRWHELMSLSGNGRKSLAFRRRL